MAVQYFFILFFLLFYYFFLILGYLIIWVEIEAHYVHLVVLLLVPRLQKSVQSDGCILWDFECQNKLEYKNCNKVLYIQL